MKLKVLVDNNTYIDKYYMGGPGASYYIEESGVKLLLDVGYSGVFMDNARKMGVDLSQLNALVLSHGHDDHTGGLQRFFDEGDRSKVTLVTHPGALDLKTKDGEKVGSPMGRAKIASGCRLVQTRTSLILSQNLMYLGEIPRVTAFEEPYAIGETETGGKTGPDFLVDDSALVYKGKEGIYIITGCSHSGICNIVEHAKTVSGTEKVAGLIGGLHLFNAHSRRSKETIEYLKAQGIKELYPCHCTSFEVRAALHYESPIKEVGVGLELDWE